MIVFWVVASLFLVGTLMMLLPPLWRPRLAADAVTPGDLNLVVHRDQLREAQRDLSVDLISPDQWDQARADIQRRLMEDVAPVAAPRPAVAAGRSIIALTVLIPLGSVLSYLALGDPQALTPPVRATAASGSTDARHQVTPEQIQKMAAALAERLKSEPNDAEGWLMLARSYTALGRYRDAVTAFRRASELAPGNAALLADFADVLGMAQGKRLAGEPARLIQLALDADPRHGKALALAGSVAFEARDFAAARGYWERLLAVVPVGSGMARSVQGSIAEAQQLDAGSLAVAAPPAAGAAAEAPAVVGEVAIAPGLAARVAPGDTLFVFARASRGPRMPLAIVKRPVGAWPAAFVLDDSSAMAPDLKLSRFDQVVIGARISRSGNATPQPGDLTGLSAVVAPGARGVTVMIDHIQP